MFQTIARGLLDLLWPPRIDCLLCEGPLKEPGGECPVCEACWEAMPFPPGTPLCPNCTRPMMYAGELCQDCARGVPYGVVFSLGLHTGPLREAIHHLKFSGREGLGAPLGRRLAASVFTRPDWIVPVPLHRARLGERGYNQAALVARGLGQELGVPVLEHGLRRVRQTGRQAKLDRQQRLANLRDAFGLPRGEPPWVGQAVLLVDDVLTTGSTAAAAATVIRARGARSVDLAVLAVSTKWVRASGTGL